METQSIEKSQRINLGSGRFHVSEINARRFNFILAFLFIGMSSILFPRLLNWSGINMIDILQPIIYLLIGLFYLGKATIAQSKTSKYAPHFLISQDIIKIKTGVFKKPELINWEEVIRIELGNYKIGIKDKTGLQYYPYQTRKETSIRVKGAIEAIATDKGIEVQNLLKR
jgi:hypothetical protein